MDREESFHSNLQNADAGDALASLDTAVPGEREPSVSVTKRGLTGLYDQFSFGIAFVDMQQRLVYASRMAKERFSGNAGLTLVNMKIRAPTASDTAALHRAILTTRAGHRSCLAIGSNEGLIHLAVLPLDGTDEDPLAVLIFEKRQVSDGLGLYFFARAHHLTGAEERLLAALCEGVSVSEAATNFGCAFNTARAHVRSVLLKTGLTSLRALIARVGNLPPLTTRVTSVPKHKDTIRGESGSRDRLQPARQERGLNSSTILG